MHVAGRRWRVSKSKWSFIMIVAAICISVWLLSRPDHRPKVQTAIIRQGTFVKSSRYYGVVNYQQDPLISSSSGMVDQIFASEGDLIAAGQLLMRFDTQIQEQALAKIVKNRSLDLSKLSLVGEEALSIVQSTDLRAEQDIKMAIRAAQVRPKNPGIVEALYVQSGDYVQAGMLVGMVRSEEKQICLTVDYPNQMAQVQNCVILSGNDRAIASLYDVQSPQTDSTGFGAFQQLWYRPENSQTLDNYEVGERVTVEVLEEYRESQTLAPLAAVGSENEIWVVENGKAFPVPVDIKLHNDQYLIVPSTLAGKRVVLVPDAVPLEKGAEVLGDDVQ